MSKDYQLSVFIGRFQPFHNEHLNVIKEGLSISDKVLVLIGSSTAAPNIKNPFTYIQRVQMISQSLDSVDRERVVFAPLSDHFYNDNQWVASVQNIVSQHSKDGDVALLGSYKDASSYYLNLFPQWEFRPVKAMTPMDATEIRNQIFDAQNIIWDESWQDNKVTSSNPSGFLFNDWEKMVPDGTLGVLNEHFKTDVYQEQIQEFSFIKQYKKDWEKAPYAPTFVTADAIVVKSGHILMIKRKFAPGKGLYALPGGFIKQDETIESAAIRELKEETRIKVDKPVLRSSIKDSKVFDYPNRSLRGRTITHGYFINLGQGELPEVKANDDASGAYWIPIGEFMKMEDKIYEDHMQIACYFLMRGF